LGCYQLYEAGINEDSNKKIGGRGREIKGLKVLI
jgi:hypothetical protein